MGTDERTTQFDALCVEGQGQDRHRLHFFYHARFSRPPIGFEVIPEHEKMYRTQPYSIGIVPQIEWFLVGALIFLSVLAWAEVLRFIFVQSFGGSLPNSVRRLPSPYRTLEELGDVSCVFPIWLGCLSDYH